MNKEHKIHQPVIFCIILFVVFDKNHLLAFSGDNATEEVRIVDRFSELIQGF